MHEHCFQSVLSKIARASCLFSRKLCQNIVDENLIEKSGSNLTKSRGKRPKVPTTLCTPRLDENQSQEVASIVAINLKMEGISWARMCRNGNHVTDWSFYNVPPDIIKSDPIRIHQLVQSIYKKLPKADLYVTDQVKTQGGSKNPAASRAFVTKLQVLSMLISMINLPCNDSGESITEEENTIYQSKIVLLRPLLVMQLFNLLVGEEHISVESVVEKVLKNESCETHHPLKMGIDALLCYKLSRSNVERENMGVALLMSITCMELLIHKNPDSFTILLKNLNRPNSKTMYL